MQWITPNHSTPAILALLFILLPGIAFSTALPEALSFESVDSVNLTDWKFQRLEMKKTLLQEEYGTIPPVPAVEVIEEQREEVQVLGTGFKTTKISAVLAFGADNALTMKVCCWVPKLAKGPCRALLAIEPVWQEDPFITNGILQQILRRNCAFIGFDHNALASYEDSTQRAALDAYPEYSWGAVAAAAWGCSITLNWVETLDEIQSGRVGVWGHSRRGKSALLAGALDERFAAVFSHMSGMGGSALYRERSEGAQRLSQLTEQWWLHENLFAYDGKEDSLPFDQHWLLGLIAPRPLYICSGSKDAWGNPDGDRAAVAAVEPVYKRFGSMNNLQLDVVDEEHIDPNAAGNGSEWERTLDFFIMHMQSMTRTMSSVLVGVPYFAGWWEETPNKWMDPEGKDWRSRFPGRVPTFGEYNTQENMDQEIIVASGYGVDFFSILWYYNPPEGEREKHAALLNRGLEYFMASAQAPRMKFMIEFCNHPPFDVTTEEAWAACTAFWAQCMKHPSYLKVDGRPVFKVHGVQHFLQQHDNDLERCRRDLDILREAVRAEGLEEPLIGGGVGGGESIGPNHPAAVLFDFTCTYMDVPPLDKTEGDYPYETLAEHIEEGRMHHVKDAVPYLPFVSAGWSPRPWGDPRPSFAPPADKYWVAALRKVKQDLNAHEEFGFPSIKAFTIYAWNEYGEGGFIAPTGIWKSRRLQPIRSIFGG